MLKFIRKKLLMEDHTCPWWLAYTFDNRIRKLFHDPEKLLRPFVREGMRVADIGCGMGVFSIGMAKLVGETGRVYSVDLQQEMLDITEKRAAKENVANRIHKVKCTPDTLPIPENVDFILCFWMVHEVRDKPKFLRRIYELLNPGGQYLIAEPKIHTTSRNFNEILAIAENVGFHQTEQPAISISRAILLKK